MKKKHQTPWLIVGSVETIYFPEWDLNVKARVDTGAQSSSLHVDDTEVIGDNIARFKILNKEIEAEISRKDWVKSANGKEKRIFVKAPVLLGPVKKEIELSLTDRKGLTYKMLLGRSAISGICLVDPSRHYALKQYRSLCEDRHSLEKS